MTRTEVIDGQRYAKGAQPRQVACGQLGRAHGNCLRNLQLQCLRRQARRRQRSGNSFRQLFTRKLQRRQIDGELQGLATRIQPRASILAGSLEDPLPDRIDLTGLLRYVDEHAGQRQPPGGVIPT